MKKLTPTPLIVGLITLILVLFLPRDSAATGPSFDCFKAATPTERLICSDTLLSSEDRYMADAYASLRSALRHWAFKEDLRESQVRWLKGRAQQCSISKEILKDVALSNSAIECLRATYSRHTAVLKNALDYELLDPEEKNPAGTLKILGKWIPGRAAYGGSPWYWCTLTIDDGRLLFREKLVDDYPESIPYSMLEHTETHAILQVAPGRNGCHLANETEYWRFDAGDQDACRLQWERVHAGLGKYPGYSKPCAPPSLSIHKSLQQAKSYSPSPDAGGYRWYWSVSDYEPNK